MIYKAALIGCGRIGSEFSEDPLIQGVYTHAEAYTISSGTDLVAVCDPDPLKLKKCQERWSVQKAFSEYTEMLRIVRPDIVSVCTPDGTHYQILSHILKNTETRAIIAEKPLAMTLPEAAAIVSLAEEKGVVIAVNYFRRYAGNHQRVRELISERELFGSIQAVSGFYSKGILHNGTHMLDLVRYLIGEITLVRGFDSLKEEESDQTLDAVLEFESGIHGFLHGCDERSFTIFELDIIGRKGRIRITDSGNRIDSYSVSEDPFYSGYSALSLTRTDQDGFGDVLLHVVDDVVSCLQTGSKQPVCSGRDGLRAVLIASEIVNSVRLNQEIRIPPQ